jgi:hypothetical protein
MAANGTGRGGLEPQSLVIPSFLVEMAQILLKLHLIVMGL